MPPMERVSVARLVSPWDEYAWIASAERVRFLSSAGGPDGFAPILPAAIHGGTMASLYERTPGEY